RELRGQTPAHILDMTLAELERRLDPARFFRIHRAIGVNLAWIGQLQADDGGHLIAGLKDAPHRAAGLARPRARAEGASGSRLRGRIDSPRDGPDGRGPWTRARDTGGRRPPTCASSPRAAPGHRWANCCAATGIWSVWPPA